MPKERGSDYARDKTFLSFFKKRTTYLWVLLIAIVYLFLDDKVLNEPIWLIVFRWVIATSLFFAIMYKRVRKFSFFYISEIKRLSIIDKSIVVIALVMGLYMLQSFLSIPQNIILKRIAKSENITYFNCNITNVITTGIDKVHFEFLDKKYSRYFNVNGFARKELIADYYLQLGVRKSAFDIFFIESMILKKR